MLICAELLFNDFSLATLRTFYAIVVSATGKKVCAKKSVLEWKRDVCRSKHFSDKNARIFTRFHFAVNEKSIQKIS